MRRGTTGSSNWRLFVQQFSQNQPDTTGENLEKKRDSATRSEDSSAASMASELEKAHQEIQALSLERDRLKRDKEHSALDQS